MEIEFIPTLHTLRELYEKPRDLSRFRWYLERMLGETDEGRLDVVVPITDANPMGAEHCLAAVNALLAIDAENVAERAAAEARASFDDVAATVRLSLVLLDDVRGAWTNRYLREAAMRMRNDPRAERAGRRRGFVVVPCWASETYTPERIRADVRAALYREARVRRHGTPRTLREVMRLDGQAQAFAGDRPSLPDDELDYTEAVVAQHLDSEDFPIQFACLFGDEAARAVGYAPWACRRMQGSTSRCGRRLWDVLLTVDEKAAREGCRNLRRVVHHTPVLPEFGSR